MNSSTSLSKEIDVKIGLLQAYRATNAYEAVRTICHFLPIHCKLVSFNGSDFGTVDENGTATGMVGAVYRGELDTFQPMFTPTYSRFQAVDFSETYFNIDIVIVTRGPTEHTRPSLNIITAFTWDTWCAIFACVMLASFFVIATSKLLNRSRQGDLPWTVFAVIQQWTSLDSQTGSQRLPIFHYIRVLAVICSFSFMILGSAYTGILFSESLKTSSHLPYLDLESMVQCMETAKCRMVTHAPSASVLQILLAPESTNGRRVRATFGQRPMITTPLAKIPKMILDERNAYLVWIVAKPVFESVVHSNHDCKFYVIKSPRKDVWTFPLRKKSPLKRILDAGAAAFTDRGLSQGLTLRYESERTSCIAPDKYEKQLSIGTTTAATAFCIWGVGCFAGLLACFAEFLISRRNAVFRQRVPQTI